MPRWSGTVNCPRGQLALKAGAEDACTGRPTLTGTYFPATRLDPEEYEADNLGECTECSAGSAHDPWTEEEFSLAANASPELNYEEDSDGLDDYYYERSREEAEPW